MKSPFSQGFTLLEMAVVITIVGFIVGGMLYGKSLMSASRLQTVVTDVDSYTTAVGNFMQTYQSLPGDFSNAQAVWGADTNCGGAGGVGAGGGATGTCNGSGNGQLLNSSGSPETFLFWQHLHLAGMISPSMSDCAASATGAVTCAATANSYAATGGFNIPAGSIKGSAFSVQWWGAMGTGDSDRYQSSTVGTQTITGTYGNVLVFGAPNTSYSGANIWAYLSGYPLLAPDQAQQVDTKMDDGLPASGKVRTFLPSSTITPNCVTASNTANAITTAQTSTYNVQNNTTNPYCSLIFVMGF